MIQYIPSYITIWSRSKGEKTGGEKACFTREIESKVLFFILTQKAHIECDMSSKPANVDKKRRKKKDQTFSLLCVFDNDDFASLPHIQLIP